MNSFEWMLVGAGAVIVLGAGFYIWFMLMTTFRG